MRARDEAALESNLRGSIFCRFGQRSREASAHQLLEKLGIDVFAGHEQSGDRFVEQLFERRLAFHAVFGQAGPPPRWQPNLLERIFKTF